MSRTYAYAMPDGPKMLRETVCVSQGLVNRSADPRRQEHSDRLQRLADECDRKRPLGPDGKHGDRHTRECGCLRQRGLADFFADPLSRPAAAVIVAVAALSIGGLWFAAERDGRSRTVHYDDRAALDCKTQPPRICGSDVTWQQPGTYPAPDGGTYTVTLVTPYMACLRAANIPGPSGFAGEVCGPLGPGKTP